jgi:uncharacterized protein (DUF488 family)
LALLVPYLISHPKSYLEHAKLRVFTISTSSSFGIEQEHRNMAALLSKFRINFSDIKIINDVAKKPQKETFVFIKEALTNCMFQVGALQ